MIWKEMEITGSFRTAKSISFSFYRHIINPNCAWDRYIQHSNFIMHYFGEDNIQQAINNRKDLYIKATREYP